MAAVSPEVGLRPGLGFLSLLSLSCSVYWVLSLEVLAGGRLVHLPLPSVPREPGEIARRPCEEPPYVLFSLLSAHLVSELPFLHVSQCLPCSLLHHPGVVLVTESGLALAFLLESRWVSHRDEPKFRLPRLDHDLLNQSVSLSSTLFS